ncbi:hypothetical protein quinque_008168 [Culex quinquefasciatus]
MPFTSSGQSCQICDAFSCSRCWPERHGERPRTHGRMTLPEPYADTRQCPEKFGTSKQRGKPSPTDATLRDSGRGRVVWQLGKPGVQEQQEVCYRHAKVECGIISARGKSLGIGAWNEIFYSHSFVCIHPKCEDLWRKNVRTEAYFTCENLTSCVTGCSARVRQRLAQWRRSETGQRRNHFVQHSARMKEKFKQDDNAENQSSGLAATNHQCVRRILVGGTAECYQHWRTRKLLRSRRVSRFLCFVFNGLFPESEGGTKHQRTTIVYFRDVRTSTKTTWRSRGSTRDERRGMQCNDVPELSAQMQHARIQACSRTKLMNVWIA